MGNKSKQLEYWQGKFGDAYSERNSDLSIFAKRHRFFKELLNSYPDIYHVLEVGCNIGGNLYVLEQINEQLDLSAIEPNKKAATMAKKLVPAAKIFNQSMQEFSEEEKYDLVFTSGMLIHIADGDLSKTLHKIYTVSKKYILTIEYYAEKKQSIPYRGLRDALFKRPYDKEWMKLYPALKLVGSGFLTKDQGFDNSNWWLYRK